MAGSTTHENPDNPNYSQEKTFRNYTTSDAAKYAAYRPSYPPKLIELVLSIHNTTGGQTSHVLDIGCGPGIATRQIAEHFQYVTGIDAGASMITKAQETPCSSATGEQATFLVSNSEDIDKHFEPATIDLITVATAAHWFDLPRFYAAASKVLRPRGSIALWCGGNWFVDPRTTPNADQVQAVWRDLEEEILSPFDMPGNKHCRELYANLDMPWTVDAQTPELKDELSVYDRDASVRREFNADGQPDPDLIFVESNGFMMYKRGPVDALSKALSTSSSVTRWREAHKQQLARGEIEDCIAKMLRLTMETTGKTTQDFEQQYLDCGVSMVLIVLKKKTA
ncbi:hypothetical protein LTS08_004957 [Lithohypha guttulata]|nr:hypothetical protein LTS08_004957 [Lithohypha guttulata]